MSFNYINLSDISRYNKEKIFIHCLDLADYFITPHVFNSEAIGTYYSYLTKKNILNTQTEYNIAYRILSENSSTRTQNWKNVLVWSLSQADIFYMLIPVIDQMEMTIKILKSIPDVISEHVFGDNNEKSVIFYGFICDEIKKIVHEMGMFDIMQSIQEFWNFKLVSKKLGRRYFIAAKDYFAIPLTDLELKEFENEKIFLGTKNENMSNIRIYGGITEEKKSFLINTYSTSLCNIENEEKPYYKEIILYKEGRELLFHYFDELKLCLSDKEIQIIKNKFQVNISEWDVYNQNDNYERLNDFSLSLLDK